MATNGGTILLSASQFFFAVCFLDALQRRDLAKTPKKKKRRTKQREDLPRKRN
jgi:hypothetical protein